MTDRPAIEIDGLSKHFGEFTAVDNLTVEVKSGGVVGFLGPNGAGKSTTIRMLLSLIAPTEGTARVLGHSITDPTSYMHRVGALIESPAFYPKLSGLDNLRTLAVLMGAPRSRIDHVLELVGLDERGGDKVGAYSLGMKQRLAIGPPLTLDGEFPHRAVGISLDEGSVLVLSIPLEGVRDTVTSTISILLWSGLAAAVAVGALVWWIIRGALRPIGAMADTADLINDGDLSQRVGVDVPGDEVGRLGTAFNSMLGRIEEAVDARTESEATMRRFVADASHELRTPLTSIRGYAELHRAGATSPEHVERAFQRIEHEARRMGVLVDDLVLLARLDEARPLSNVEVDLAGVVEEAVTGARAVEPGRSISIRGTHGDYRVAGDPDRLRQVIDNLLGNVRAHTPAESTVEVGLERRGDDVVISVSDNGPGMGEDAADRAFERFFQEGDDRSTPGSGLGLAIVRSIVEAHHGSVELESQSGRGTTVTVVLPSL